MSRASDLEELVSEKWVWAVKDGKKVRVPVVRKKRKKKQTAAQKKGNRKGAQKRKAQAKRTAAKIKKAFELRKRLGLPEPDLPTGFKKRGQKTESRASKIVSLIETNNDPRMLHGGISSIRDRFVTEIKQMRDSGIKVPGDFIHNTQGDANNLLMLLGNIESYSPESAKKIIDRCSRWYSNFNNVKLVDYLKEWTKYVPFK